MTNTTTDYKKLREICFKNSYTTSAEIMEIAINKDSQKLAEKTDLILLKCGEHVPFVSKYKDRGYSPYSPAFVFLDNVLEISAETSNKSDKEEGAFLEALYRQKRKVTLVDGQFSGKRDNYYYNPEDLIYDINMILKNGSAKKALTWLKLATKDFSDESKRLIYKDPESIVFLYASIARTFCAYAGSADIITHQAVDHIFKTYDAVIRETTRMPACVQMHIKNCRPDQVVIPTSQSK
jgi:hypothetical protein